MIREYIVYRDSIVEALQHLDDFKEKMDKFVEDRPNYSYKSEITEKGSSWEIKVTVQDEKQRDLTTI